MDEDNHFKNFTVSQLLISHATLSLPVFGRSEVEVTRYSTRENSGMALDSVPNLN